MVMFKKPYLCVELVKNVFQVVTFDWLFWVKQLKKLLHELRGHEDFQSAHFDGLIYYKLQEEFVDAL